MHMYIVNIHVCDVWLLICLNSNKPIPWFDCYTQLSPSDVLWPRGGSWSRGPASDPCRSGVGSLFAKTNVRPTVAGWNCFFWYFSGVVAAGSPNGWFFIPQPPRHEKIFEHNLNFDHSILLCFFFAVFIFFAGFIWFIYKNITLPLCFYHETGFSPDFLDLICAVSVLPTSSTTLLWTCPAPDDFDLSWFWPSLACKTSFRPSTLGTQMCLLGWSPENICCTLSISSAFVASGEDKPKGV